MVVYVSQYVWDVYIFIYFNLYLGDLMPSTNKRSLMKAFTYRISGTIWTFGIAWAITGSLAIGGWIALAEAVVKVGYYWLHERIWKKIKWGKI